MVAIAKTLQRAGLSVEKPLDILFNRRRIARYK
jgi:hypothetical protein